MPPRGSHGKPEKARFSPGLPASRTVRRNFCLCAAWLVTVATGNSPGDGLGWDPRTGVQPSVSDSLRLSPEVGSSFSLCQLLTSPFPVSGTLTVLCLSLDHAHRTSSSLCGHFSGVTPVTPAHPQAPGTRPHAAVCLRPCGPP